MPKMTTGGSDGKGAKGAGKKGGGGGRKKPAPYDPSAGREVKYPEVKVKQTWGDKPLTAQMARELLGWQEEAEGSAFGDKYFLKDLNGVKVRCLNNVTNRPFYSGTMEALKQEILMKRWSGPNGAGGTINGESIIIGKTGLVLNGQHTLVALVLAVQEYAGPQKAHWEQYWDREPVIDKPVFVGIDETDKTTNTMDTCKPRSLMDVIYRSPYFAHLKESDRRQASRITDYEVRMLWNRTWAAHDPFAPRRTHSEALDFIARHQSAVDAVGHIVSNNAENAIGSVLSPGYAAAFLYLMAASGTSDADTRYYGRDDLPTEKSLDLSQWQAACDYWTAISSANIKVQPVRDAVADLLHKRGEGVHLHERVAIVLRGWAAYLKNGAVLPEDVALEYVEDDEGVPHLKDPPVLEGIDRGDKKEQEDARELAGEDPSEEEREEVEEEKERVKAEGLAATRDEAKAERKRMTKEERAEKARKVMEDRALRNGAADPAGEGSSQPDSEGSGAEEEAPAAG